MDFYQIVVTYNVKNSLKDKNVEETLCPFSTFSKDPVVPQETGNYYKLT